MFKKVQKKLKIFQLTRTTLRTKLSAQSIAKLLKGFWLFFFSKKCKRNWKYFSCLRKEMNYVFKGFQNFFKDFNSDYFVLTVRKKLKIVQLISYQFSWLSVQRIFKTLSNMFLGLLLCQFCLIVVNISWNFSNWFSQVTSDKCLIYYYFKSRNCLFFC